MTYSYKGRGKEIGRLAPRGASERRIIGMKNASLI